jgi:cell division protein FtsQ
MPSRTSGDTAGHTTAGPAPDATTARSRRRFARRQWARRWLTWRPVAALLLVILLLVGGLWLVFFSSVLAVDGVDVEGTHALGDDDVRRAAAVTDGEPLARVDLDAVRARVEALAMVRSADVTRQWPDHVLISVEERVAVAVVEIGGQVRGMDADGVVFRDYAQAPPGLPHVRTATDTRSDALREAAQVIRALPEDLAGRVDYVSVATVDQIELVLRDGRTVVWGSAEESEQKAAVLEPLLRLPGQTYDVSVPSNATVAR